MKRLFLIAALAACCSAHASDGVIEINQAKVDAAGGGTYVISQPGSYRLTSNLLQTAANAVVISITADRVTLDLNGFAISGSNTCAQASGTMNCTAGNAFGYGVHSVGKGVRIRNGILSGLQGDCVRLGAGSTGEDLQLSHCSLNGFITNGTDSVAQRLSVRLCGGSGIYTHRTLDSISSENGADGINGFEILRSAASNNIGDGIYGYLISGNRVSFNRGNGLTMGGGGLASNNYVLGSGGYGISVGNGSASGLSQNVVDGNTLGATNGTVHSIPTNSNLCNGTAC